MYRKERKVKRKIKIDFLPQTNDRWIVPHNPLGLTAWGGNMDMSLLIDANAVVEYVAEYITKSEPTSRGLQNILRTAIAKRIDSGQPETKKILRTVFNLLSKRDKCSQGVNHLIASRPLVYCSHQFIDINLLSEMRQVNNGSANSDENEDDEDIPALKKSLMDLYELRHLNASWRDPHLKPSDDVLALISFAKSVTDYTSSPSSKIIPRKNASKIIPVFSPEFSSNPDGSTY